MRSCRIFSIAESPVNVRKTMCELLFWLKDAHKIVLYFSHPLISTTPTANTQYPHHTTSRLRVASFWLLALFSCWLDNIQRGNFVSICSEQLLDQWGFTFYKLMQYLLQLHADCLRVVSFILFRITHSKKYHHTTALIPLHNPLLAQCQPCPTNANFADSLETWPLTLIIFTRSKSHVHFQLSVTQQIWSPMICITFHNMPTNLCEVQWSA
jgi:hypothetical protein